MPYLTLPDRCSGDQQSVVRTEDTVSSAVQQNILQYTLMSPLNEDQNCKCDFLGTTDRPICLVVGEKMGKGHVGRGGGVSGGMDNPWGLSIWQYSIRVSFKDVPVYISSCMFLV